MANVSFMARGIKLWAEYKDYGDHDIELLSITLSYDEEHTNIEPLLGSDIIELAYKACEIDIAEIDEYNKEAAAEMRYYDDQPY